MNRLRMAVVGAGHLGRIHARALARRDDVELVGVIDPIESARTALAGELGCRASGDYHELAGQIDAAVVATPTSNHTEVGLALLNRGVHLLIEKPLAPTAADAEQLVVEARRQSRVLQVGHIERFNPAWTAALPHLRQPKYISAARWGGYKFRSLDIGVVLDLMIHDLDLIRSVVRAPLVQVQALGLCLFGKHEDVAHAQLTFADGCVAVISASRASREARRAMQLGTPEGFVHLDFGARSAELVTPSREVLTGQLDAERMTPGERAAATDAWLDTHLAVRRLEVTEVDQISAELLDFTQSIRAGRSPRVSGDEALAVLQLAEQIQDAIRTHAWDGSDGGRRGPRAVPTRSVVPAPHFLRPAPARSTRPPHREAG